MASTLPRVRIFRRPDGGGFHTQCTDCLATTLHPTRRQADDAASEHVRAHVRAATGGAR